MGRRSQQQMTGMTQQERIYGIADSRNDQALEKYLMRQFWGIVFHVARKHFEPVPRHKFWLLKQMI